MYSARPMGSFAAIIEAIGVPKYAATLDIPYATAAAHKQRNSIPALYWSRVVGVANASGIEGVSMESLAALVPPRARNVEAA
jgi:hypothetical protein